MTDENSSPNNSPEMRRKQDTIPYTDPVLSPPDVAADNQLKRSISRSQTYLHTEQFGADLEKCPSTGLLYQKLSPQNSDENEGRNRDSSSQLDIDQSVQSGISTPRPDSGFVEREEIEDEITKCFRKADVTLQELIDTEKTYAVALDTVVDTYIPFMEESKKENRDKGVPPMPEELKVGRDKIALCNIRQIHTYQKKMVAPDVFDCLENPWKLRHIFTCKQDRLKDYYGKYSINKPKSELIVEGSKEYFQLVRYATNTKHNISTLLMAPVQRVTRYPLLLETINNLCDKAKAAAAKEGKSLTVEQKKKAFYVKEAWDLSLELTNYVNDMMEAGKILHYQGNGITENGLLIEKSDVLCSKRGHNILKSTLRRRPKSKSCQIFIFEKGIVLAEKVDYAVGADRGQSFVLKHLTTFTMNNTVAREVAKCPNDPAKCGFELERIENTVKDGSRSTLQTDIMEPEINNSNIKSQIIQCETEEQRNRLLQCIFKRQKVIKEAPVIFANPGIIKKGQKVIKDALDLLENPTKADPEKIYAKKCDCEKISDDL